MTSSRHVYYIPDHFERPLRLIEIGTMLRSTDGRVWFVARMLVNREGLREADLLVIKLAVEDLHGWHAFNALPLSTGPHVVLGEVGKGVRHPEPA